MSPPGLSLDIPASSSSSGVQHDHGFSLSPARTTLSASPPLSHSSSSHPSSSYPNTPAHAHAVASGYFPHSFANPNSHSNAGQAFYGEPVAYAPVHGGYAMARQSYTTPSGASYTCTLPPHLLPAPASAEGLYYTQQPTHSYSHPHHPHAQQHQSAYSHYSMGLENGAGSGMDLSADTSAHSPPHTRLRTIQACEKCRVRKAKCSGDRPTCGRCSSRGLLCEYAPDRKMRGPNKPKVKPADGSTSRSTSASGSPIAEGVKQEVDVKGEKETKDVKQESNEESMNLAPSLQPKRRAAPPPRLDFATLPPPTLSSNQPATAPAPLPAQYARPCPPAPNQSAAAIPPHMFTPSARRGSLPTSSLDVEPFMPHGGEEYLTPEALSSLGYLHNDYQPQPSSAPPNMLSFFDQPLTFPDTSAGPHESSLLVDEQRVYSQQPFAAQHDISPYLTPSDELELLTSTSVSASASASLLSNANDNPYFPTLYANPSPTLSMSMPLLPELPYNAEHGSPFSQRSFELELSMSPRASTFDYGVGMLDMGVGKEVNMGMEYAGYDRFFGNEAGVQ